MKKHAKNNGLNLRLIGWRQGDSRIDAPSGYQAEYYWHGGEYLGPDEDGIEPVYASAE